MQGYSHEVEAQALAGPKIPTNQPSIVVVGMSCLALRYEALVLRDLKSATYQWLQVSYREWLTFAEHSLDNGFYSIARKVNLYDMRLGMILWCLNWT
ncbi:hypothetical protein L1049_002183 [Liquidambar formosana]|uniref:Uncharacterized protein n=1 Tax=Liquidambar formosana TaxID=63359 RepID=A0AAP0NF70_LIQFO